MGRRAVPPDPPIPPDDLPARELDHARCDVQTDGHSTARSDGECDVAGTRREIERAHRGQRRGHLHEAAFPPPVLTVRERDRDEVVTIGDRGEQASHVPPLPFGRRNQFNKSQGSRLKAQHKSQVLIQT
jgi:hypothetical protein